MRQSRRIDDGGGVVMGYLGVSGDVVLDSGMVVDFGDGCAGKE